MIWAVLFLILIVLAWYWHEGRWDHRLFAPRPGFTCENLRAPEARVWLEQHPETQVLDVRSAAEFSNGALPGAVNISLGDEAFDEKLMVFNPKLPVLVYCAGGYRSRKAVEQLKERGFENILHLHRGYMSWKARAT
jgi:rhodanese-related sulfurtransferase